MYFCKIFFPLNLERGNKLKGFKKHIALICFFVLSIPTLIQTIHLFEDHEHHHLVCTSETEQHFHENDAEDCSFLHYQFEVFDINIASSFEVISVTFYTKKFNEQPQITHVVHPSKKTSRGPPLA